jgi:hypothetical protein
MMLALRMGRTLGELHSTMSSQEFSLWLDMYEVDQWGEARDDFRAGTIASTVANYAGKTRAERAPTAEPGDFMPSLAKKIEEETDPDPVAYFTAVAATKPFEKRE